MARRKEILAYIASIVFASIFGFSFLFSKMALEVVSPIKLLAFRFLIAFFLMSLLLWMKIIKVSFKGKNVKELIILSMTQPVIYFLFEIYGIKYSSTSYAGLIIALIPIVVTLLAIYLLKEIPSKMQWIFIILSVVGVAYIVLKDSHPESSNTALGTIFLVLAVLAGSLYNIFSRKSSLNFTSTEITYFMMGTAALVFNSMSLIADAMNGELLHFFQPIFYKEFLISVLYLGVLSSVLAFFSMNYALSILPASKAVIFGNLTTVISIIAGVIILKEGFYYYHIVGSILILIGIIGTNYFGRNNSKEDLISMQR